MNRLPFAERRAMWARVKDDIEKALKKSLAELDAEVETPRVISSDRFNGMVKTFMWNDVLPVQSTGHLMPNPHRMGTRLESLTATLRILFEPAPTKKEKPCQES